MKSKFSLSLLLVCIISSVWSFSLGVYRQGAASDHIVNSHSVSDPLRSLTSIDIADICARVTGNIPLLREGISCLSTFPSLQKRSLVVRFYTMWFLHFHELMKLKST